MIYVYIAIIFALFTAERTCSSIHLGNQQNIKKKVEGAETIGCLMKILVLVFRLAWISTIMYAVSRSPNHPPAPRAVRSWPHHRGAEMPAKPMRIYPGSFSGRWYATKHYKEAENGIGFVNTEISQEDVTEEVTKIINWVQTGTAESIAAGLNENWKEGDILTREEAIAYVLLFTAPDAPALESQP